MKEKKTVKKKVKFDKVIKMEIINGTLDNNHHNGTEEVFHDAARRRSSFARRQESLIEKVSRVHSKKKCFNNLCGGV